MAEGKDYCERKINLLKSNFDQLIEVSFHLKSMLMINCTNTYLHCLENHTYWSGGHYLGITLCVEWYHNCSRCTDL